MWRSPLVLDAVAAAVVLLLVLVAPKPDDPSRGLDDPTPAVIVAVLTCAAIVLRSFGPTTALVATTAGTTLATLLGGGLEPLVAAVVLSLYSVAVRTDRRSTLTAWAATVVALVVVPALWTRSFDPESLSSIAWTGLGAAVGEAVRSSRAHVGALEERARRAERTREDEARRRVAEERLHIARELHDVVAHQMAVVTVQSGVAGHLLRTNPDAAEAALRHVRTASATVLGELGDILSVLRRPDDPPGDPTAPAPGLDRLDALVASFGALGLTVSRSTTGRPRPLGPAVDLVAYRLLEEALTNAHKHGDGSAVVTMRWTAESLTLEAVNPVRTPGGGGGHGLTGMRERATVVGGSVRAGPTTDGRWRVDAVLPVPAAPHEAPAAPLPAGTP